MTIPTHKQLRHDLLDEAFGEALDAWVTLGHERPHQAERWFQRSPGEFLKALTRGYTTNPIPKENHGAKTITLLPNGIPVQVEVIPAYVPEYVWLSATVSLHRHMLPRLEPRAYYPTPLHVDDVKPTLQLWQLEGLKWDHFGCAPVFSPTWKAESISVNRSAWTYFTITTNHRYFTVGTACPIPVGAKRLALVGPSQFPMGLERIGGTRVKQERVEGILLEKTHVVEVPSDEAVMRRDNGQLYKVTPKALVRIARFCAKHYHRNIVEGKRDLMKPYRDMRSASLRDVPR